MAVMRAGSDGSHAFAYASYGSYDENSMLWRVMADIVVAVHAAYVAIVVVGFAAILIGSAAQWRWVRNFYFRAMHLAMILLVCAEALAGASCPLTATRAISSATGSVGSSSITPRPGVHGSLLNVLHARALDPLVRPGAMARISNPDV
jgi:hypothetical protein